MIAGKVRFLVQLTQIIACDILTDKAKRSFADSGLA